MNFINQYFDELIKITNSINREAILRFISGLKELKRNKGRLFIFGIGGSAANATHAVNDFRKICNIEAYAGSDNFAEFSARVNDDGWDTSFSNWLKVSNFTDKDAVLIFSVGGGSDTTSKNLVEVIKLARYRGGNVFSIVSRDGGYARLNSTHSILIPVVNNETITPHAEEWQAILWHLIVTYIQKEQNEN